LPQRLSNDSSGPGKGQKSSEGSAVPLSPEPAGCRAPRVGTVAAALGGFAGAWLAAGSSGLLAHPLQRALTWACLLLCCAASWAEGVRSWRERAVLLVFAAIAVLIASSTFPPVRVVAVACLLAGLGAMAADNDRRLLMLSSAAAVVLGVYRLALTSIPVLWLGSNWFGQTLGAVAGWVTGRPLRVGATFAGIDFLVLMAALYTGWLMCTPRPRLPRALYAGLAILIGHICYLMILSFGAEVLSVLPESLARAEHWSWAGAVRTLVPWNFPVLAGAIHLAVAGAMFRWCDWPAEPTPPTGRSGGLRLAVAAIVLAALLPVVTVLSWRTGDFKGKKVVAYEKGFLNWLKPKHGDYGRLSIGMYGLLPTYVESLGGRCVVSPDLSESDLADASIVILLYPNQPWAPGQLERLWSFARRGGSLLVFGEHTIREPDGGSRFNDVLAPTAMRVRFDSAMFEVGGWLQSYELLAHPATAGIADDRNQFGVVIGASLEVRYPARPLLIGRYGWADPGDVGSGEAMMGNHRYDAGERLGDLVLAAEQPFGTGKVVAFGDTSTTTNGINVGSHVFTSRLLNYLAGGATTPQAEWRQVAGLLICVALFAVLAINLEPRTLCGAGIGLALSLTVCTALSHRAAELLPDGRGASPNNLAYIDTTHMEASSSESWRPDGTMGLAMTLMRNGYLTLDLPEFTTERLRRAGLLVSIAPHRGFSTSERRTIREFVNGGGIFICTVGWDESRPSRRLLADFGIYVGGVKAQSGRVADVPHPLGHFKAPYMMPGDYMVYVRFHAAWPVECTGSDWQPIAYGVGEVPVIIARKVGQGRIVVVGDTCFAMNKNLEHEGGEPFEGMRENADFWRWFLTYLRGQRAWVPPNPQSGAGGGE